MPSAGNRAAAATADLCGNAVNRSPFCERFTLGASACEACIETNRRLNLHAEAMGSSCHCFASQLGQHAESPAIIEEGSEPAAIARTRKHIHENLGSPLPHGTVSRVAGLSEAHFCRLFKEAAGLTLTVYVNRCRIGWAKKEFLKPEMRVSEIPFLVGYQSLSRINRSFGGIVGSSPTCWRREKIAPAGS